MYRQFAGEDYLIDAKDLRDLLNALCLSAYGSEGGFSLETARSLLAMYDTWHLGVVSSEEASKVWAFVKNWKERFDRFDKDNSRSIDSLELRRIFRDSGFSLSLASSMALSVRYGGRLGSIGFDDFILLVAKTKRCYDSFISFQANPKEDATVNLEQWMEAALYL
ncbi:calpain small subunit 1-like [Lingula anatina]|uniref:Calpain small subunit 1-like n=1 Tax=Lingula anatina TaxID=7574 RepID=A0A1S3IEB9_LINAN|nr:calpain small subunit 1-like [Lingula anatina]|eukprot:XP_013395804.1 calpain small subunit 1-like [Lingula anatina]